MQEEQRNLVQNGPAPAPDRSGLLHLALVLARIHHARLLGIDANGVMALPGVARVMTARDVRGTNRLFAPQGTPHSLNRGFEQPVICDDTIRRYGDIVAVVAANTRPVAREAAARIKVACRPLRAMLNFAEAARPGAPSVHEGIPNVFMEQPLYKGQDPRPVIEGAACAVEAAFSTTREPHLPLEPDAILAWPDAGGVVIRGKVQDLHGMARRMAPALGLAPERIRIIATPAGGSFGAALSPANCAVAAACALALAAPVSLVMSYEEHLLTTGKRAAVQGLGRLACDARGRLVAGDFLVHIDQGAYSEAAGSLTTKMLRFFGAPYRLPQLRGLARTAFTNGNFGASAFGTPQAHILGETLVDMLARKLGVDPFEFRWQNLAEPGDTGPNSVPFRVYSMRAMMDKMRPTYQRALSAARRESRPERRRGVGVAWGGDTVSGGADRAEADVELNPDGSVTVYSSWAELGQGADLGSLMLVHEALRPLKLQVERIHLARSDSACCPDTGPTTSNRSHHAAGLAIIDAANSLLTAMRRPDGAFRTWAEMRAAGLAMRYRGRYQAHWPGIDPDTGRGYGAAEQNFVLYVVEVAVEPATGQTTVLAAHMVADAGRIAAPQSVRGQAFGGFAQSLGFALTVRGCDGPGQLGPLDAGIPQCRDVPDIMNLDFVESPRDNGPFGSTGCAEGFQSAGCVAILNAIADAVGLRITALPATPAKVKAALEKQAGGEEQAPWNLASELYAHLARLRKKSGV